MEIKLHLPIPYRGEFSVTSLNLDPTYAAVVSAQWRGYGRLSLEGRNDIDQKHRRLM